MCRWLPIGQEGTGDVALLRVREPLRRAAEVWDRPFRALGFADGAWDGVWSSGVLRADDRRRGRASRAVVTCAR